MFEQSLVMRRGEREIVPKSGCEEGWIITIDGANGAGKATQAGLLFDYMQKQGKRVAKYSYPEYDTPTGDLIKRYLNGEFGSKEELLGFGCMLYGADRIKNKTRYKEQLEAGTVIINDRFMESNWGIQGGLHFGDPTWYPKLEWMMELEKGMYHSDLVIYLDVPPETTIRLMEERKLQVGRELDIHEKDVEFVEACSRGYRQLVDHFEHWHAIRCVDEQANMRSRQEIAADIAGLVGRVIEK
jgi:dTMP kinase